MLSRLSTPLPRSPSTHPRDKKTVRGGAFAPLQRELAFNLDMTDYDSTSACKRCWAFISVTVRVLDSALHDQFGFHCLLGSTGIGPPLPAAPPTRTLRTKFKELTSRPLILSVPCPPLSPRALLTSAASTGAQVPLMSRQLWGFHIWTAHWPIATTSWSAVTFSSII